MMSLLILQHWASSHDNYFVLFNFAAIAGLVVVIVIAVIITVLLIKGNTILYHQMIDSLLRHTYLYSPQLVISTD